jgi:hypothetical protein
MDRSLGRHEQSLSAAARAGDETDFALAPPGVCVVAGRAPNAQTGAAIWRSLPPSLERAHLPGARS